MKIPHKVRVRWNCSYEVCWVDRFDDPEQMGECRLYEYMMKDPVVRLSQYFDAKYEDRLHPTTKREVAKKLGWDVP